MLTLVFGCEVMVYQALHGVTGSDKSNGPVRCGALSGVIAGVNGVVYGVEWGNQ